MATGCRAVRDARSAQEEAAGAMSGERAARPAVDLKGRSLEQLVEWALENRPSMQSARLAVEDARLALKEIAADAPVVSAAPWNAADVRAGASYSEQSKTAHFSDLEGKTRRGKPSAALSLDVLVWDFGRNAARARAQAERTVAAECSLAAEGYAVFEEVSSCYFALVREEALLDVAETNLVQYAAHLERAQDLFEQGEAQRLDVLRARLDLSRAKESLVAASNDVATAGANLMSALGVPADRGTSGTVVGRIGRGPAGRARAFADTSFALDEAFALACANTPSMQAARARLRAASAQVDEAIAELGPSLSASLSMNWTDPLWYWKWGLSAAQDLFTGWRRTTAVERARNALESARADVEAAEQKLSLALEIAIAERDNARTAVDTASESLARAKENLDTVSSQFEVGDVSRIDFTDAVSAYAEAQADGIKAFCRAQTAEAALFGLLGARPEYVHEASAAPGGPEADGEKIE